MRISSVKCSLVTSKPVIRISFFFLFNELTSLAKKRRSPLAEYVPSASTALKNILFKMKANTISVSELQKMID